MFLDDYPLRSMEVQHEPSDNLLRQARRNRKINSWAFIVLAALWLVCIIATLIERHGERNDLNWAMLVLSVLSLLVLIKESRSLTIGCSIRSVKIGFLGLVGSSVFSRMNTIEIRYSFKKMQEIAIDRRQLRVTMAQDRDLEIPVEMFASERDMRGFAKALSVAARCELVEGVA